MTESESSSSSDPESERSSSSAAAAGCCFGIEERWAEDARSSGIAQSDGGGCQAARGTAGGTAGGTLFAGNVGVGEGMSGGVAVWGRQSLSALHSSGLVANYGGHWSRACECFAAETSREHAGRMELHMITP